MKRGLWLCAFAVFIGGLSFRPVSHAHLLVEAIQQNSFVTVSAASYRADGIAPESIVAGFGVNLSTETLAGRDSDANQPGIQLPTRLAGVTVLVNNVAAPLFFVSPSQINYQIPANTPLGEVAVVVTTASGGQATGMINVVPVAPAIFTANADGVGVPAAYALRVTANGGQLVEAISTFSQSAGRVIASPISLGPDGERVFLILYLTGIRRVPDPNNDGNFSEYTRVILNGAPIAPAFAGVAPGFAGLEQINVEIPRSLLGGSGLDLQVVIANLGLSNKTNIEIVSPSITTLTFRSIGLGNRTVRRFASIGSYLFAATNQGVWRSTDSGSNWINASNGLPTNADVRTFLVDGSLLYAGMIGGGVYVSPDNGQSWSAFNNGLAGSALNVGDVISFAGRLYVATQGGVHRYLNGGWVPFIAGLTNLEATALLVYSGRLYVGTRGDGVFLLGSGNTWIPLNNGLPNTGLPTGSQVLALANAGAAMYAGLNGGGLHVSRNNGQTWTQVAGGISSNSIVNAIQLDGTRVYAGSNNGVYVTTDNGVSWSLQSSGLSGCSGANIVTALQPFAGRLLVGTAGCGVYGAPLASSSTNRPPVAHEQTAAFPEDTPIEINLSGFDADLDQLSYAIIASPTRGTLSGTPPNVTYSPNTNYNGRDSFTFRVSDGRANSNIATINLEGTAINDAPVITVTGPQTVVANQSVNFTVSATDPDAGQVVALNVSALPQGATFNTATGVFSWTPTIVQVGAYSLAFTATDNGVPSLSQMKTVLVNVIPPSNTPNGFWSKYNVGLDSAGFVYGFASVGNKLFAGTEKGVYRLENNGWQLFSNGLPAVTTAAPQARLIFDLLANNNDLYGLLKDGVYRSTDLGVSWKKNSLSSLPTLSTNSYVMSIRGTAALIAGQFDTSFFRRSADIGVVFAPVGSNITASLPGHAESAGSDFYIATYDKLIRSANNGTEFSVISNGLSGVGYSFAANGQILFAATSTGVFRSTDNGSSWGPVNTGLPANPSVVSLHYRAPFLFAGTTNGIYYSLSNGGNWTPMNTGDTPQRADSLFVFDGKVWAVAGTRSYGTNNFTNQQGVYVSPLPVISGNTPPTITVNDSYTTTTGSTLSFNIAATAPEVAQTVAFSVAGLPAGATFNTASGVFSWMPLAPGNYSATFTATDNGSPAISTSKVVMLNVTGNNLLGNWVYTTASISPRNLTIGDIVALGNSVYAIINSSIYRSKDGGSWTPILEQGFYNAFASISGGNGALYVSNPGGGPFSSIGLSVSKDGGDTWQGLKAPSTSSPVKRVAGTGNTLVALLFDQSVYSSKDAGQNWTQLTNGIPNGQYSSLVQKGTSLFLAGKGPTIAESILRSDDGGTAWISVGGGIPAIAGASGPFSLVVKGADLYAGGVNIGVLRSIDNGNTWTLVNGSGDGSLPSTSAQYPHLAANERFIFANSHRFSMDNGASWLTMNSGENVLFFGSSQVVITDKRVYASTGSRIYGSNLPGIVQ